MLLGVDGRQPSVATPGNAFPDAGSSDHDGDMSRLDLHPDRMLPADATLRPIAREIYQAVRDLPIISPTVTCPRSGWPTMCRSATPPHC